MSALTDDQQCHCECHEGKLMHFAACCGTCPACGLERATREHIVNCMKKNTEAK